jgi:hypothetical protein
VAATTRTRAAELDLGLVELPQLVGHQHALVRAEPRVCRLARPATLSMSARIAATAGSAHAVI